MCFAIHASSQFIFLLHFPDNNQRFHKLVIVRQRKLYSCLLKLSIATDSIRKINVSGQYCFALD